MDFQQSDLYQKLKVEEIMIKNNVTRLLDSKKIKYTAFELPPEKLGAVQTAELLDVPPKIVFKSIVVTKPKGGKPLLVIIPGPDEVDLKEVAKIINEKKVSIPTQHEAEQLTGLQAGGISPLALLNRGFQFILDEKARSLKEIHISGGQRGLNIRLSVNDLIQLIHAKTAPVSKPNVTP